MNISWRSPMCKTSYGYSNFYILRELSRTHEIAFCPIGQVEVDDPHSDHPWIKECMENANFYNKDAPSILFWHQFDLKLFIRGSKYIAWSVFELDNFNEIERHNIEQVDELWVCSEWAKSVVLDKTKQTNVKVVHLGIDTDLYQPIQQQTSGPYRFFYHGKWELRKCADIIPELFSNAFEKSDDVELWAMTSNPFLTQSETAEWENFWKSSKLGDKIKFIPWAKTQKDIYDILKQVNCHLGISRAEGVNLPLLTSICCGLPAIATNYAGHRDFCTPENSFLIDPTEYESAQDFKWFHGQGNWMKITEENKNDIISNMKYCYNSRTNNTTGLQLRNKFSWRSIAGHAADLLSIQ